jgi:hypothetical protein
MTVDPGITEELPLVLAARAVASAYSSAGVLTDINIGGLPFFLACKDDQPYVRETNDYKREQIDTSPDPGEQTLSQWWVRDQDSWHHGAGVLYYEPGADATTRNRVAGAVGIDVWTRGQATLLKATSQLQSAAGACYATGARVSGADVIFGVAGGTFFRHDGTTKTSYTGAGWTPSTKPAVAGAKVLVGGVGGVLYGDASGSTLGSLYTDAALVTPWWAKGRVIMARANDLFEGTLSGGGADVDTLTPICRHPDSGWTWTSVAEAPDCILASGYSNGNGAIFAFNLVTTGTSGGTPTLDQGVQVAELPTGEEVYSIQVYLGTYIAIGTSKGVRIGVLGNNGKMQYGPLTIETTQPVRDLAARDHYVYAAIEADIDGGSGCARIDLAEEINQVNSSGYVTANSQRYAWAYDAQSHTTGAVYSVAFFGGTSRVVLAVNTHGIYLQSATSYETTGYLLTGRIRYATAEDKTFSLVKVRTSVGDDSSLAVASIDSTGTERSIVTFTSSIEDNQDVSLGAVEDTPQTYISIRTTLNASTDGLTSPTLETLQVKATPNPHIQRNIRMPLKLQDMEEDANGQKVGYVGSAYIRLARLEQLENDNSVVAVLDRTSGESYSAQIRKIQFVRTTPPSRNKKNFGGVILLDVLKL